MSDAALNPTVEALHAAAPVAQASIAQIFLEFLLIGATSLVVWCLTFAAAS